MPNPAFFKDAFDRIAVNEAVGDPRGLPAYSYLRVSSDGQADEGKTGLPRQIRHVGEAGIRDQINAPWSMIFADDESGFTLDRPGLQALIQEISDPKTRRSDIIIFEHLDRLSRDVDWQQGYLLQLLQKKYGMKVVFWKQFGSRVERVVLGAISQDGMESEKERMREGMLEKARDNRVTSKSVVAYGYQKVDSNGQPGEKARVDTHYGIVEYEAKIVRYIFEQVAYSGRSLRDIAADLCKMAPTPKGGKVWGHKTLHVIIKNPAYKGQFAAFRFKIEKVEIVDQITGLSKKVIKKTERPQSEWELVDVPPIVSEELWQAANDVLEKNKMTASRNSKTQNLLVGLIKCGVCGKSMVGHWASAGGKTRYYTCSTYRGNSRFYEKCGNKAVKADLIEDAVWKIVQQVLETPDVILHYLDEQYLGSANQQIFDRIDYIEGEIKDQEKKDQKALALYNADGYTAEEYAGIHKAFREQIATLKVKLADLQGKVITQEKIERQKAFILELTRRAREKHLSENPPYEVRRNLIKIACDAIFVNVPENKFTIQGDINGIWPLVLDRAVNVVGGGGEGGPDGFRPGLMGDNDDIVGISVRCCLSVRQI